MNNKIAIVIIALVGIGLYALPATMALFAGQHSFVNIDPTGNQVQCEKCHGDVSAELASNVNLETGTKAPHAEMECSFCHRLQIGQSSGDNAYALIEYGAAVPNQADLPNTTYVRRWIVVKAADYEAGLYPADFAANATTTKMLTGATAGVSAISPIYLSANLTQASYDTPGLKFKWNYSELNTKTGLMAPRSRQTDMIGANGVGVVTYIARGTILPLYNAGAPIDTNDTTKDTAFNPAFVAWNQTSFLNSTSGQLEPITSPIVQPAIILDGAGSRTVNAGSKYHAASLVACMDCHAGASPQPGHETARLGQENATDEEFCQKCHYGTELPGSIRTYELSAGGFGNGLTNNVPDTGVAEVHKPMATAQDSISVYGGRFSPASNDGCIACHTHVDVEISYHRPTTLQYTATENTTGGWNTTDFAAVVNSSFNTPGSPAIGGVSTG